MRLGFTGSHHGITEAQLMSVRDVISGLRLSGMGPDYGVHGACRGGDDEFDQLCVRMGLSRLVHPSTARTRVPNDVIAARGGVVYFATPKPPTVRDRDVVHMSNVLVACPYDDHEVLRSGTWTTVRYARTVLGVKVRIFTRSGREL